MNRVLRKRLGRELKTNFARYLALVLLIVMGMYIIVSVVASADTIIDGTAEHGKMNKVEDGQFGVFIPLTDEQEKEITDKGITLEQHFSIDVTAKDGSKLRVFRKRNDIEKIIETTDPVYTFCEVIDHIDLNKYLTTEERRTGRPRYDEKTLLKVILFAFMENGYESLRKIEKLCKTDIRFMWLLQDESPPSHMTIDNFMNNVLNGKIEEIFADINAYIFEQENVDMDHVYIDGTKITANANKYSWVWKKSCEKNRVKVFAKITELLSEINKRIAAFGVKFGVREEYAIEYLEQILKQYIQLCGFDPASAVRGRGHHKTPEQRYYDKLTSYIARLKKYAEHIKICGNERNSYSKTDHDATFMRMKKDYMGNDQLLPGYNIQFGVCDEYIAVYDVKQYASDMDCFKPLMEKFHRIYGKYPEYPVTDAGYGSFNNYLYCEEHGMGKYMKFTMYEKESKNIKYHNDPYRAVNFRIDENGDLVCPNNKKFHYVYSRPIKGNKYGRTEEFYQCEECANCSHKEKCCKCKGNRIVRINEELTAFHKEVLNNLNCIHGALLRMNRSIQSEGANGIIKWNRSYTRARRRGLNAMNLEIAMICCGFNLHKFHLKKIAIRKAA